SPGIAGAARCGFHNPEISPVANGKSGFSQPETEVFGVAIFRSFRAELRAPKDGYDAIVGIFKHVGHLRFSGVLVTKSLYRRVCQKQVSYFPFASSGVRLPASWI